jgi:hypothetical protein
MTRRKSRGRRAADRRLLAEAARDARGWQRGLRRERREAAALGELSEMERAKARLAEILKRKERQS